MRRDAECRRHRDRIQRKHRLAHQGEIYGIVTSGVLTHYESDYCRQDGVYGIGAPITDPTGSDHVHIARNLGTTPVSWK